jgi:hypothetical protein
VHGIEALIRGDIGVQPLQALQAALRASAEAATESAAGDGGPR